MNKKLKNEYKVLTYKSLCPETQKEDYYTQPKSVEIKLKNLEFDGWEVLFGFNTPNGIELLLWKDNEKLSPKQLAREKVKELRKFGSSAGFDIW